MATALTQGVAVPDHVPANLVWDKDFDTFVTELPDPYDAAARLYAGPEIIWARGASSGKPGWLVTRLDLMNEIMMDAAHFSNEGSFDTSEFLGVDWKLNPLEIDPPAHMGFRQVLQPTFMPTAIRKLEPEIRAVCKNLIAAFLPKDGCEFVGEFSVLFPSRIFLSVFGLPKEQQAQFLEWAHTSQRAPDIQARIDAHIDIKDFLAESLEDRKQNPRDDLLTIVANASVKGRPLTHGEKMGMCMVLFLGGLDTVTSSLGWHFRHLALHPDLQRSLRDHPDRIPEAVDELLRAFPVVGTRRTVKKDISFHGVDMRKGEIVALPTPMAGRDPAHYESANVVDFGRKARHLTLGTGVHNCLGVHLARMKLRVVLEEWMSQVPQFRIGDESAVRWHSGTVWGLDHLPLTWA